jgi:hypothetical protein
MEKIEIKSIRGSILFSLEKENNTVSSTVENAILSGADLRGANLSDADLRGANLRGANLSGAYLSGACLRCANLRGANLSGADLSSANLSGADLSSADLSSANLRGADLIGADLSSANLRGADLSHADLSGANLRGANLIGAYLNSANLRVADLSHADLSSADLSGADLSGVMSNETTAFFLPQCPSEGGFIAWKKAGDKIIKIKVTEDAMRSSATTLKCRCSKAEVLEIQNFDGSQSGLAEIPSDYDKNFRYTVGEIVEVADFDENRWNECSSGIHFFINREMAVAYK